MEDLNSVVIIGRLTKDAELKYTNSGLAISSFSIAMNKRIKQGEQWAETAIFINDLCLFGKRAEGLNQYLTKGQQVAIEGCLDVDKWEQDGKTRSKLKVHVDNIQLLGGKRDGQQSTPRTQTPQHNIVNDGEFIDDDFDDDRIPF